VLDEEYRMSYPLTKAVVLQAAPLKCMLSFVCPFFVHFPGDATEKTVGARQSEGKAIPAAFGLPAAHPENCGIEFDYPSFLFSLPGPRARAHELGQGY
jgi:hypothetical protein